MDKFIIFCVLFYGCLMHITYSDVSRQEESSLLTAQLGKNITLNCNITGRYEMAWYHLNAAKLTLLVSVEKDSSTGIRLLISYNQNKKRMKINADSGITVVSLVISEITESDLGLYFCGTKSDTPEMHFDRSIRVQLDENLSIREEKDHSDRESKEVKITDDLTLTDRVLMFGGVGLAFVIFFFVTMAAAGVIHQHGWQKGWTEGKNAAVLRSDKTITG